MIFIPDVLLSLQGAPPSFWNPSIFFLSSSTGGISVNLRHVHLLLDSLTQLQNSVHALRLNEFRFQIGNKVEEPEKVMIPREENPTDSQEFDRFILVQEKMTILYSFQMMP